MDGTRIGRRQILTGTGAAVATGALATFAWPAAAFADDDNADDRRGGVVGTWLVDVASDSAGPGDRSLVSFAPGGVVFAVDGSRQDPIPPQSGQWEKRRGDGFAATFVTFLYDNNPSNPSLNRIGLIKIVVEGTAARGSISGRFRVAVSEDAGDVLFEDTGSFAGNRVEVDAL
jgi:hypothetical protein